MVIEHDALRRIDALIRSEIVVAPPIASYQDCKKIRNGQSAMRHSLEAMTLALCKGSANI
jgi:hypothetical protein